MRIWNVRDAKCIFIVHSLDNITAIAWSFSGYFLFCGTETGNLILIGVAIGRGEKKTINSVRF